MIGDRWRDMAAGRFAGCRTVFVDYGYEEQQPESPDAVVGSLTEAMPFVLG
jgi:D-glycero-D-manno-heptose 1,7-bisphosphate phosphatase